MWNTLTWPCVSLAAVPINRYTPQASGWVVASQDGPACRGGSPISRIQLQHFQSCGSALAVGMLVLRLTRRHKAVVFDRATLAFATCIACCLDGVSSLQRRRRYGNQMEMLIQRYIYFPHERFRVDPRNATASLIRPFDVTRTFHLQKSASR